MSEAGWAERKVRSTHARPGADVDEQLTELCVRLLLAEHRLAVRVVKAARKGVPSEPCEAWKDGYMTACDDILTALQKGRT